MLNNNMKYTTNQGDKINRQVSGDSAATGRVVTNYEVLWSAMEPVSNIVVLFIVNQKGGFVFFIIAMKCTRF